MTRSEWPRTGRLSVAVHDVAVALFHGGRFTLDFSPQTWDTLDTSTRCALLNIAEHAITRATWLLEDRERRAPKMTRAEEALTEIAETPDPRD